MTATEEAVEGLLTQNTGKHMLDSGFANGRHWQRNRGRDFRKEPASVARFLHGSIVLEHSVFHFLNEHLVFDAERTAQLKVLERWARMSTGRELGQWELAKEAPAFLALYAARADRPTGECPGCEGVGEIFEEGEGGRADGSRCGACRGTGEVKETIEYKFTRSKGVVVDFDWASYLKGYEPTGIYGEGDPVVLNTCNEENLLSQTLQFVYFTSASGEFVVLQVHGGADVRGGYTDPVVFETNGNSELGIFDYNRGCIHCEDCDANWTTDDGCRWYADGACGLGAGRRLEGYEARELMEDNSFKWKKGMLCFVGEDVTRGALGLRLGGPPMSDADEVASDDDVLPKGQMFCPGCGGRLHGSM